MAFPCTASTSYAITKTLTTRFRVALFDAPIRVNLQGSGTITNNGATEIDITTGANTKYIGVYLYNSTGETKTISDVLSLPLIV